MPYSSGSFLQSTLLASTPPGLLLGLTGDPLPLELEDEESESEPEPESSSEAELSDDLYPYNITQFR